MINQIRADFYREWHTRGIWLTAALTILYSVVLTSFQSAGGVSFTASTKLLDDLTTKHWTIQDGIHAATYSSSLLLYLFIALFVIVIGYEFSQFTYKNTLISGISRFAFILAKYVTLLINLFISSGLFFAATIMTSVIAGRPVGTSWGHLLADTGITLIASAFFVSVVFSLGILVLIMTASLVVSAVFIVVWPLVIGVLTMLTHWHWLTYLDFFNTATAVGLKLIATADLWRYITVSAGALAVSMIAATILIRNREL